MSNCFEMDFLRIKLYWNKLKWTTLVFITVSSSLHKLNSHKINTYPKWCCVNMFFSCCIYNSLPDSMINLQPMMPVSIVGETNVQIYMHRPWLNVLLICGTSIDSFNLSLKSEIQNSILSRKTCLCVMHSASETPNLQLDLWRSCICQNDYGEQIVVISVSQSLKTPIVSC